MKDSYFSDVVLDWTLKHPEVKEDFKITYDYWAPCQAFRIRMESIPYKHGVCELLDEDIVDKMVCPHDYIFAVLDRMYMILKEDEEQERIKLHDSIKSWLLIYADPFCDRNIKVKVESCGNGYAVDLIEESDGKSISARGRITRNHEEAWGTFASNLYKKFKEKERKEMGYFSGTVNVRCTSKEDNDVRLKMAKAAVVAWYNEHNAPSKIGLEDVYIVWFCKVLQNWKALAGTHHGDGMYYEVTYDGDKDAAYVDAYKKWQNVQMDGCKLRKDL